ncbi:MAG: hypothetical protein OXM61_22815 [Candidatus Poribacteria bacterium]|nr:hypothetical protein [Candidatus Poribacteria bacterium]
MKYSKVLIFSGLGCVAVLLLTIGVRLQAQNTMKMEMSTAKLNKTNTQAIPRMSQFRNSQQSSNLEGKRTSISAESENSDFYKVIVNNNLFRPLGWKPPNKEPEYILIGTASNPNGDRSEAFVLEQRSNKFYVASVGDKIGYAVVKEIQQKKVILDKNGETITIRSGNMQFLKSGGSRHSEGPTRSKNSNQNAKSDNENVTSELFKTRMDLMKERQARRKEMDKAVNLIRDLNAMRKMLDESHQIIRELQQSR